MSRGQLARTRANFPRMKDRAYGRREGPVVSWGGGMYCPCGARVTWGAVRRREWDEIEQIIEAHAWCEDPDDVELEDENEGDWICEHTRPELWAEGRALVEGIIERKQQAGAMIPLGDGLYRVTAPRSAVTGRYRID